MTIALWSPADLAALPGARLLGGPRPVTGASIDTRSLAAGDLFFALKDVRDGHDFVPAALAAGAAAAVVESGRAQDFAALGPLVAVPDVLGAMADLGRTARARTAARIVAVTGSVGKTGTKEALRLVLSRFGGTHAAAASFNNHWGVPLTLARMPADSAFGVFEIGMNHAGEIAPLTAMVRPEVAVITTIEPVHIGHFRSIHGIADAKGEIFLGLQTGGVAVLPRDNPHCDRLAAHALAGRGARIIGFGEGERADVRALRIATASDASVVEADVMGQRVAYRIGMPGRHVALNSLAVLAVAAALGLDVAEAASACAELRAPEGRGERILLQAPGGAFTLVDESFNANPASMRAALATLPLVPTGPGGRRIAVLADMGELGETGPAAHAALAEVVATSGADLVFAAGPLMAGLWERIPAGLRAGYAASAKEIEPTVLDAVRAGDVVMVKGSKATGLSKVAAALKSSYAPVAGAAAQG